MLQIEYRARAEMWETQMRLPRIQGLPLVDGQMSLPHNVHHRMRKGDHLLLEGPDDTAAILTLLASDDDDDLVDTLDLFLLPSDPLWFRCKRHASH